MIKDKILLGGVSDSIGKLTFPKSWNNNKVNLQKFGFKDTTILIVKNGSYCLKRESFNLKEVNISSREISLEEQLKKYVEKTLNVMQKKQDTSYYNFTYTITVPDRNWKEIRKGIFMIIISGYNKKRSKIWLSRYCSLNTQTDSVFWNSPIRKNFVDGILIGIHRYEGIREGGMLTSQLEKGSEVQKEVLYNRTAFEITSKITKDRDRSLVKVLFNSDSLIESYEYRWLNKENETRKGLRKHNNNSTYIKWDYNNENSPINYKSLEATIGFKTDSGINHIHNLEMSAIENYEKSDGCLNKPTIFLRFNPKVFKVRNLRVQYFK